MAGQLFDIQKIMRVNKHALDELGNLLSIKEQYGQYTYVARKDKDLADRTFMPLVLIPDCSIYEVPELDGKPLVLFNSAIDHIETRHGGTIEDISLLPNELKGNLLVYQDPKKHNHFVFVLQEKSPAGNRYIAAMDVETQANAISVNRLITCHGKRDLNDRIAEAIEQGLKIYPNERTGIWLNDMGILGSETTELAPAVHQRLSYLYCTRYPTQAAELGLTAPPSSPSTSSELQAMGFQARAPDVYDDIEINEGIER